MLSLGLDVSCFVKLHFLIARLGELKTYLSELSLPLTFTAMHTKHTSFFVFLLYTILGTCKSLYSLPWVPAKGECFLWSTLTHILKTPYHLCVWWRKKIILVQCWEKIKILRDSSCSMIRLCVQVIVHFNFAIINK